MGKYEYQDGERRWYKRIDIRYDQQGEYQEGYYTTYHWYIDTETYEYIGLNPPCKYHLTRGRKYFPTIAEAKRYIDNF